MNVLFIINFIISILFLVCYSYQFFYIPFVWFGKDKPHREAKPNRYAVLICARNESTVIGDLLDSLRAQTYDASLLHVFVLADNCTDDTADVARAHGATVYQRFNKKLIGKGYALNELLGHIRDDYPGQFDAYAVFDADNILSPDYMEQMNRTFSDGYEIVTGYRNTKNFGDNWISAGYGLWYLRESRYLNHARCRLGTSCAVNGTGFVFSSAVADEQGGWPYHLLVEDIEFSTDQILKGKRIGFCPGAVLYDEQPTGFAQSWRQRERWCKGAVQVFVRYGGRLVRGIGKGSFACYDMIMGTLPAYFLSVVGLICNVAMAVYGAVAGGDLLAALGSFAEVMGDVYLTMFAVGAITTVSEWGRIRAAWWKKVLYTFTFPLFMFTYMPIAVAALFKKVEWKPIEHKVSAAKLRSRRAEDALPF
ncbi:MAG: glycosyltransferase family 2 protein [Oscillospiraceae bacterium]|nr:glycosyltransferase family 2 protein [Oscillospiraceae bacterium]